MTLSLLCFSLGILIAGFLPELPSPIYFLVCIPCIFYVKKSPLLFALCAFLMGMIYGILSGYYFLNNQLTDDLVAKDLIVEGQVINLPQENDRRQLFELKVNKAYFPIDEKIILPFPGKINISSFGDLRVKPGEQWRLAVKLKKPRGFVNPGGFDYQVSLLRKGVGATGYIRENSFNQLLAPQPAFTMDKLRYDLQQWLLKKSGSPEKAILIALLVGDTSFVDKERWGEMQKTGTTHLIAIKGL